MHIGIIGCGQLAQMMALAGQKLQMTFSFLAENIQQAKPVEGLGEIIIYSEHDSTEAIYVAMGKPDLITIDNEDVDVSLLKKISHFCFVAPSPDAVEITQNRSKEKSFLRSLNIPTVDFAVANTKQEVENAIKKLGYPVIIKSVEEGYDGKNQSRIPTQSELQAYLLNYQSDQVVIEKCVEFSVEVSLIAARRINGEMAFYSLIENRHKNGVLLTSIVPTKVWAEKFEDKACDYLKKIMDTTNYVGVMAMECFIVNDQLIINELAPRVHNSGHWTIDGCFTSQFENHLRAIAGLSLGNTALKGPTGMINLLGKSISPDEIKVPNARLYWYNKESRPGRKMGHINVRHTEPNVLNKLLLELEEQLYLG